MNKEFKIPPRSIAKLTPPEILVKQFSELIGRHFPISGKTRTDGSNIRKLIAANLEKYTLPPLANTGEYEIVPPKGKGVPKITREFIDTYIVTSGDSYNLQVWNRIPASHTLLIKYESGESLQCSDVRFVLVQIDIDRSVIASIIILTPEYIEQKIGKFGQPTVKQQLLISSKARKKIYGLPDKILLYPDSAKIAGEVLVDYEPPKKGMMEDPETKELFSIQILQKIVAEKLVGLKLHAAATKNRGRHWKERCWIYSDTR
jgi:hypothetical protein